MNAVGPDRAIRPIVGEPLDRPVGAGEGHGGLTGKEPRQQLGVARDAKRQRLDRQRVSGPVSVDKGGDLVGERHVVVNEREKSHSVNGIFPNR